MPHGDDWLDQLKRLGQQVVVVLAKLLALLLFVGLYRVLDLAIMFVIPKSWLWSRNLLEAIVAIAFFMLYVDQLWEMLAVFVPRLGTLHGRFVRGDTP